VGEQGHIAGALNIALEDLPNQLASLGEYEERMIVTICRTDKRSAKAAKLLAREGFADVHVARMGMTDWNKLGYEII